jgi:hypothetical protein
MPRVVPEEEIAAIREFQAVQAWHRAECIAFAPFKIHMNREDLTDAEAARVFRARKRYKEAYKTLERAREKLRNTLISLRQRNTTSPLPVFVESDEELGLADSPDNMTLKSADISRILKEHDDHERMKTDPKIQKLLKELREKQGIKDLPLGNEAVTFGSTVLKEVNVEPEKDMLKPNEIADMLEPNEVLCINCKQPYDPSMSTSNEINKYCSKKCEKGE